MNTAANQQSPQENRAVDAATLHHKVLVGYQGWFRCKGDRAGVGWRHWSRDARRLGPKTLTFEMWPDMTEYGEDERCPVPGFIYPDGKPAHVFSSAHPMTVERHFRWMQQYRIDGVLLQRFIADLDMRDSLNMVLANVQRATLQTGRVFALGYDLSGAPPDKTYDLLVADWKRLVDDLQITKSPRYLHHNPKPVLFIYGFYPAQINAALADRIIDFFKTDPKYGVTLIGGTPHGWRTVKDGAWAKVFRRLDVISPWNVGNYQKIDTKRYANTDEWKEDLREAKKAGMSYLPVIYPGFGWTNLKGKQTARDNIPRLGGEFLWRQFVTAAELGMEMAYVAMFDEVDEGTAIFKVTNAPPTQAKFATYEGLPSDWYLRLTGAGTQLIRGERTIQRTIPIKP
jgi:hypothetical protein